MKIINKIKNTPIESKVLVVIVVIALIFYSFVVK